MSAVRSPRSIILTELAAYTLINDRNDPKFNLQSNKLKNPSDYHRRKVLFSILAVAKQQPGQLFTPTFLQVVYLFHSGDHPQRNRTLQPIVLEKYL